MLMRRRTDQGGSSVSRLPLIALVTAVAVSALDVSTTASGGRVSTDARTVVKTAFNKTLKTTIIVDGHGRTVYMTTGDTNGKSACAGTSADSFTCSVWPALT